MLQQPCGVCATSVSLSTQFVPTPPSVERKRPAFVAISTVELIVGLYWLSRTDVAVMAWYPRYCAVGVTGPCQAAPPPALCTTPGTCASKESPSPRLST